MANPTTKAVRIMAEWCSNGIWSVPGLPPESLDGFRISPGLYARLQRWLQRYTDLDAAEDYSGDHTLEAWADFSAEGYAIAFAVKAELPDWRVVYVDECLLDLRRRLSVPIEIPARVN
jgi:hypothetical protein